MGGTRLLDAGAERAAFVALRTRSLAWLLGSGFLARQRRGRTDRRRLGLEDSEPKSSAAARFVHRCGALLSLGRAAAVRGRAVLAHRTVGSLRCIGSRGRIGSRALARRVVARRAVPARPSAVLLELALRRP